MKTQEQKAHIATLARARYARNPHSRREGNRRSIIKQKYGITFDQKYELLSKQNNACAICKTNTPPTATGWHVDHCHRTNAIRGILCQRCNNMLGNAIDDPCILRRAAEYLEGK